MSVSTKTPSRVIVKPRYFHDNREYEFVAYSHRKDTVVVALFHDPRGLMDEVFGFQLSPKEAEAMGRALLAAAGVNPSA